MECSHSRKLKKKLVTLDLDIWHLVIIMTSNSRVKKSSLFSNQARQSVHYEAEELKKFLK